MKVLITGRLPDAVLADVETAHEVVCNREDRPLSRKQLLSQIEGKDGLPCMITDTVDTKLLQRAPGLKIIAKMARMAADNLLAGLSGQKPPNCLNWDTLCDKRPP